MEKNDGKLDRVIGFIIAAIAMILAVIFGIQGWFGWMSFMLVISVIMSVTAYRQFCALYLPFKISTNKK
jgi:type IV secretory pathway VirB2 component (pilin)